MTTNNHEVIFAIVNAGFAEDAMDVARADEAAFFGISIHHEKEILMMVVEKSIRDNVLNALYKEMGMAKQAQGIVFSLPVSDVAGLVQIEQPKEAVEENV